MKYVLTFKNGSVLSIVAEDFQEWCRDSNQRVSTDFFQRRSQLQVFILSRFNFSTPIVDWTMED